METEEIKIQLAVQNDNIIKISTSRDGNVYIKY
ncbi:hypothetical protein Metvu_0772 [Methanocaldococcus vulcanius M7]|uniref:Uncharacterized protein n=2 Tax=Methanocaldococcus TaxID=196118 RepID=C9RGC8_METVM|nr:hypothetical protein Metvu_0772 [Methanocaldococcus vulcanius M7]